MTSLSPTHDLRTPPEGGEDSSPHDVGRVTAAAAAAAATVAEAPPAVRVHWLREIADGLERRAAELAQVGDAETSLGVTALEGEIARTAAALHFYAAVAEDGGWIDATIDRRTPKHPDLRRMNRPLGPVAVFGASNFPFGFGVVGHDTASAIAAGCPVIVKAHPAHPHLSRRLAGVALDALSRAGAPDGTFGMVFGLDAGTQLVTDPNVSAVAFTGSEAGGMALWRLASTRDRVIPVFAEMGTVNVGVVTRRAAIERTQDVADGFVNSFLLRFGQCCTKPGLLLVPASSDMTRRIVEAVRVRAPQQRMLTAGMATAYGRGINELVAAGARVAASTAPSGTDRSVSPTLFTAEAHLIRPGSRLLEECFGPTAIVVEYADDAELTRILDALPGGLAAAVHLASDDEDGASVVAALAPHVGRVLVNDWPTGVSVSWSQHHGGPWPSTTVPAATSVGAGALHRFLRPVAYQEVPQAALPPALQDANPWGLPRRIDGKQLI